MSINVSKNMIKTSRNQLLEKHDEINKSRFLYDSVYRKAEDLANKLIYKLKDAIYKCEKEITKAKKVRDENQSTKWQLHTKRSQVVQAIGEAEWELKNLRYPTKPRPTDNLEVDKANREAYEAECDRVDEAKDRLRDLIDRLIRQRDDIDKLLEIIETNDAKLKEIIYLEEMQISNIRTKISNIETKLKDLRSQISNFISRIDQILRSFTSVIHKVDQAYNHLDRAVQQFAKAEIYIKDNEVVTIDNIAMVMNKLIDIKKSISNAYVVSEQLNKKFVIANTNLKDNTMTEAKTIIIDINKKCEEAIDVLKRLDEIVSSAMEYLRLYEQVF